MLPAMTGRGDSAARHDVQPIGDRLPLLIGLLLAALTFRPQIVGLGPLVPEIQRSLGVSHAMVGLLVTIPVICLGLFSPVAPILAGRIGAIRAVSLSIALIGVAGLFRAFIPGIGGILVMTFLIGVGMGVGNALMVVAVRERFPDHPLLLTSVYATGIQIGSALGAVLAVPIALSLHGWQSTLLVYSVFTLLVLGAWLIVTRNAHNDRVVVEFPRFPFRRPVVWLLAAMFGLMGILYYGINTWVPAAYIESGASAETAGLLGALYNIGMVPGPLLVVLIGERVSRRRMLLITGGGMGLMTIMLIVAPGGGVAWMLIGGVCNGAMFTLAMSLPLQVAHRPVDVGAAAAMMLFFGYLITALAPSLLGGIRDVTGNYDAVMLCFPFVAVLYLVVVSLLSPARLQRAPATP